MMHTRKTVVIAGLALATIASAASADITLYGREDFRGRSLSIDESISNLESSGFNDRASSVVVRGGPWLVCSDAYFRGHCTTLRPGEYPSLAAMGMNDSVSSARQLRGERYGDRGDRYGDRDRRGESRVVLYEGPNFSGGSIVVDDAVRNLDPTGFNDRARSLRVEGSPWVLCSDEGFRGDCRTFNPGEYPYLPDNLNHRISSGHRVGAGEPYAYR
jgi:hypothetical protein